MIRPMHRALRIALVLLALLVSASVAFAQDDVTDDEVNDVAQGLFCPVCESEPLDTCPTQACIDWREEIRAQLADGQSKEQIYANFRARYGDRVLAQPPVDGVNIILWFTIPVALVVGGYLFARYLRGIRQPIPIRQAPIAQQRAPSAVESEDEYVRRIEDELNRQSGA